MESLSPRDRNHSQKLLEVSWLLLACHRGTLWQVEEELWKELFADYNSDRKSHPGLCFAVKEEAGQGLPSTIMTLGSSGNSGPMVVKGVTLHRGINHPTSFGALLAPVAGMEFVTRSPQTEPEKLSSGHFLRARSVVNWDKRLLSENEASQLDQTFPEWLWV